MSDLTGPPPPPGPDPTIGPAGRDPDEIASALLDGELSPEDAARAQADPEVVARVTALRQVRTHLRDVPPPPQGHADRAVAAALGAVDLDLASPPSGPSSPPPLHTVPTAAGPSPASPVSPFPSPARRGHPERWLAAAAAVAVVALLAVGILSRDTSDSEDTAAVEAHDESTSDTGGAQESSGEGGGGADVDERGDSASDGAAETSAGEDSEAPTAATDVDVYDLGGVSRDGLVSAVTSAMADGYGEIPAGADDVEAANLSCPGLSVDGDTDHGRSVFVADATLDGTRVRIHVYDDPDVSNLIVVATTQGTCTEVVQQPFGR
jgi:hypothetical protein